MPSWVVAVMAVLIAVTAAFMLAAVLMFGTNRMAAVAVAGALGAAAMFLSGNPRLLLLWGLMLTLPLNLDKYFTEFSNRGGGAAGIRIEVSEVFLFGLIVFLAWDIVKRYQTRIRIPKVTYIWFAIMLMGIGAVTFGEWRRVAGYEVISMAKQIMLFLVICNELRRSKQMIQCVAALIVSMFIQGAIGVIQYVRGSNLGLEILGETNPATIQTLAEMSIYREQVWRVSALMLHPNLFAIFLAALLPLACAALLIRSGWPQRFFYLLSSAIGAVALIATFSRSGWVSFAAGVAFLVPLLMAHGTMRRRLLIPALLAALCFGGVFAGFSDQITQRLFQSKEVATFGREVYKQEARAMIAERPIIGFGLNSYVDEMPKYSKFSREAHGGWIPPVHNIYYLWWAELGIIGLSLHLAVIGSVLWIGVRNLQIRDPVIFTISVACMCGIVAFIVDGFMSFSLRISSIARLFWVLAGLILAAHYWRLSHEAHDEPCATAEPLEEPDLSAGRQ